MRQKKKLAKICVSGEMTPIRKIEGPFPPVKPFPFSIPFS